MQLDDIDDPCLSFNRLQQLRNLESDLAVALSMLEVTIQTLQELHKLAETCSNVECGPAACGRGHQSTTSPILIDDDKSAIANSIGAVTAYHNSAKAIQARIEKVIQMVCFGDLGLIESLRVTHTIDIVL